MFDLSCLKFFSPFPLISSCRNLSKLVEIPRNNFRCEIQTDLLALGSPLLCLRVCKTVLPSFGYDLKLNLVLKLDFEAFKKSHLIAPIMLRKLFTRAQEFFWVERWAREWAVNKCACRATFARVSKGRARQDKIILRLKFGGNVICYFCAVWLENEARLIYCRRSAIALRPLAG